MSSSERPYRTLRELVHAHCGVPAVVMGGGPSLPGELDRCPRRGEAVYLSANDHGAKLAGCDYIVAHDKVEDRIRPFGVPLISRHLWADYRYVAFPAPNTGVIAAWIARSLGCAPIYIAGMDCWSGGTYWHDEHAKSSGHLLPPTHHLDRWLGMMRAFPADYRPMGGVLATALRSQPLAAVPGPVARDRCLADVAGVFVKFVSDAPIRERAFRTGERAEVTKREAERLIQSRQAVAA